MPQPKNLVVYTAISGNYNPLRNPSLVSKQIDYVCFTDQPLWHKLANNTVWNTLPFPRETQGLDSVRACRMVKLLPHLFFPKYDYSIWVDGSIDILGDVHALLAEYDYPDMLCFKHPRRSCIYEEGRICIELGKDDPLVIRNQLQAYGDQGFPSQAGLIESGVLIRRHNTPVIQKVMEDWWREIKVHSRRDQLSFPYIAWRNHFTPTTMGSDSVWGTSKVFALRMDSYHGDKNVTVLERLRILAEMHLLWRFRR